MPFFRGSSRPRDWTHVYCISCFSRQILYHWTTWEAWTSLLFTCKCVKHNNQTVSDHLVRASFAKGQTSLPYWLPSSKLPHLWASNSPLSYHMLVIIFLLSQGFLLCCQPSHLTEPGPKYRPHCSHWCPGSSSKDQVGAPSHPRYKTIHTKTAEYNANAVNSHYPWDFSGKPKCCLALLVVFLLFSERPCRRFSSESPGLDWALWVMDSVRLLFLKLSTCVTYSGDIIPSPGFSL